MDLPWGDERSFSFAGSLGLVSSSGPHGYNLMSCEWTNHISYSPGLVAIHLGKNKATQDNIKSNNFFGVSIASSDQSIMASVAGKNSGRNVDKIAVLTELGFKFYKGKKIDVMMVEGVVLNMECKVYKTVDFGDHTMIVGEVLETSFDVSKNPLIYYQGKYWKIGERIPKPSTDYLNNLSELLVKHKK